MDTATITFLLLIILFLIMIFKKKLAKSKVAIAILIIAAIIIGLKSIGEIFTHSEDAAETLQGMTKKRLN